MINRLYPIYASLWHKLSSSKCFKQIKNRLLSFWFIDIFMRCELKKTPCISNVFYHTVSSWLYGLIELYPIWWSWGKYMLNFFYHFRQYWWLFGLVCWCICYISSGNGSNILGCFIWYYGYQAWLVVVITLSFFVFDRSYQFTTEVTFTKVFWCK